MNVGQVCSRPAIHVAASASLSKVARLMYQHRVGTVLVAKEPLDHPVVVGIVTDRDIVRAQLERATALSVLSAEDVMTRDPLELCETDSLADAIQRMRARGVRRAPVVTQRGILVGVVSTDDLVRQVAVELSGLATLLSKQHAVM